MKNREIVYLQMLAMLSQSNTPRGRKNIAEELKIGEGVVRTLLEGGKDLGHVAVMKGGVKITEGGLTFLKEVLKFCGILDIFLVDQAKSVLCGKRCIAHVTEGEVKDVVKVRDSLVRLGSCGALILNSELTLPPFGDSLDKYSPELASYLRPRLVSNTTLIITCGETFVEALTPIVLKCSENLKL
ncbi:MAG: hypothetical protein QXK71_02095 [Pyrobaculum sp.]|jgi:DNA-binding transcriptional regulator LsrR (DeoR family)